jgi:hypothetical protein
MEFTGRREVLRITGVMGIDEQIRLFGQSGTTWLPLCRVDRAMLVP